MSVGAYEVVIAQATKNIGFLNQDTLSTRLGAADKVARATWHNGVRQADRSAMNAALATRRRSAPVRVVVVQPHVAQPRYQTLYNGGAGEDRVRLRRLETLLNAARVAVVGVGAEFVVVSEA